MKKLYVTAAAGLLAAMVTLTASSCKKEQQQQQQPAVPAPTPEQKAKIEEIKKEVKKSTEEAKRIVVAQVNGVDITMHDLVGEMNAISQRDEAQGKVKKPRPVEDVKKEALDNLIFKELAIQESIKQGIVVGPERVDAVVKLMKEQSGSAEEFKKYLEERQMTEAELRKRIERSHQFELITGKEIYQKVKLDEKEMRADYDRNKNEYRDNNGRQLSYEESANFIRRKLMSQKGAEMKKVWADALKQNASIKVFKEGMK